MLLECRKCSVMSQNHCIPRTHCSQTLLRWWLPAGTHTALRHWQLGQVVTGIIFFSKGPHIPHPTFALVPFIRQGIWGMNSVEYLRLHPGLQICGHTVSSGALWALFNGCLNSSQPGDQDQCEQISFTIDVKTDKAAKEIKPVSLKRSILNNASAYVDLKKKKNLTLPTKDRIARE